MTGPNGTASAALGGARVHPCFVGWLDFDGDPVRVTTAPYAITFSGTGDAELDGFTYDPINAQMVAISDVQHAEGGSDTVTATLSGLMGLDTDLLNIIGDKSKWQGQDSALWLILLDESLTRVGNVWRYYTGTMVSVQIKGGVAGQVIELQIENYLASLSQASGRTYLDQERYDSGDKSAEAAIAIANGTHGNGLIDSAGGVGMYGGGGGGGGGGFNFRTHLL